MIGPVPVAATEKDAGEFRQTVWLEGLLAMVAASLTMSVAADDVAEPHELVMTQS